MAKERNIELKVGILVAVAAALLAGFVVALGNFSLHAGERLYVDFDFSGNLQAGAPVKISGIKVGKVEEVVFWGGKVDPQVGRRVQVRVKLFVENQAREAIRQDAEFFVNTAGVLGEQYLEVAPGDFNKPPLAENAIVRGVDPPRTDLIVARLYEFLDAVTSILRDDKEAIRELLQSGAGTLKTVDSLLKENQDAIGRVLGHLDQLTAEAQSLVTALHKGVGDGARLDRTLGNIEALSGAVRKDIDPLLGKTKKALDDVSAAAGTLGPEEKKKISRALDDLVSVADKADGITSDAQALVADLRKGKGTTGSLLVNPEIYDDLKELVRDLKRNPWKFFWKE